MKGKEVKTKNRVWTISDQEESRRIISNTFTNGAFDLY